MSDRPSRFDRLVSWRADWAGLHAVVLGLGPTGFSIVDTLAELGVRVTVIAAGASAEYRALVDVVGAEYRELDPSQAGEAIEELAPDLVLPTPLYGPGHPALERARLLGIPVWSDVELAWRLRDKNGDAAEWITVTGLAAEQLSLLTAAMLRADGRRAAPAGGRTPVLDAIRAPEPFEQLVVQIGGHQLHWTGRDDAGRPRPLASLCLGEGDLATSGYANRDDRRADLARVYEQTRIACVYHVGEESTREMVEDADVQEGCRAIGVGLGVPGPSDLGIVEDLLVDRAFHDERHHSALEFATLDELALIGVSGAAALLEVLGAAALARAAGVELPAIRSGVADLRL